MMTSVLLLTAEWFVQSPTKKVAVLFAFCLCLCVCVVLYGRLFGPYPFLVLPFLVPWEC